MKQLMCGAAIALLATAPSAQVSQDPTQQPRALFPGGTVSLSPPQPVYNCFTLDDLRAIVETETEAAATWQYITKSAPQKDGMALCGYFVDSLTDQTAVVTQLHGIVPIMQYPPFSDGIGGQVTVVIYQGFDGDQRSFFVALGHPYMTGELANAVYDFIAAIKPQNQ